MTVTDDDASHMAHITIVRRCHITTHDNDERLGWRGTMNDRMGTMGATRTNNEGPRHVVWPLVCIFSLHLTFYITASNYFLDTSTSWHDSRRWVTTPATSPDSPPYNDDSQALTYDESDDASTPATSPTHRTTTMPDTSPMGSTMDDEWPKTHHLKCLGPLVCFFFFHLISYLLTTF
jgi:hypothetical protein